MQVSDDQVDVFTGLQNIRLKILIVKVYLGILVAFAVALIVLMFCKNSPWQDKAILGTIEGILVWTIKPMSNHFFPAYHAAKKSPVKK